MIGGKGANEGLIGNSARVGPSGAKARVPYGQGVGLTAVLALSWRGHFAA